MCGFGILFMICGAALAVFGFFLDISLETNRLIGDRVVNLHLLSLQSNLILSGVGLFISGSIFMAVGSALENLNMQAKISSGQTAERNDSRRDRQEGQELFDSSGSPIIQQNEDGTFTIEDNVFRSRDAAEAYIRYTRHLRE